MKNHQDKTINKTFSSKEISNLTCQSEDCQNEIRDLKNKVDSCNKREEIMRFILMLTIPGQFHHFAAVLIDALQEWSGCEAVGIRLKDGDDYPYYESRGFPHSFVKLENKLCKYDSDGIPFLECMCGNVLCGRTDPAKAFFTSEGSFWSNSTTDLIANTTDSDMQTRTRNQCNAFGYESVALIPLRLGEEVFGLLQFNDHRKNKFTVDFIRELEKIAICISSALLRRKAEEDLRRSEHRWAITLSSIGDAVIATGKNGNIAFLNQAAENLTGWQMQDALNKNIGEVYNLINGNDELCSNSPLMLLRKDGRKIPVEMVESSILSEGIEPDGTVIVFRDVSVRNKAEAELREKELNLRKNQENLRSLLDQTQSQKLKIQIQNERLESLLRIAHYKMSSPVDLFNYVLKEAINLTFSKDGYIFTYNEADKKLILNSMSFEAMERCRVENHQTEYDLDSTGLWGEAIRQGRAIVINDYLSENEFRKGTPEGHISLQRFLTIPIIIDDSIKGVVGVANKDEEYESSDVRQLTLLMDTAWRIVEYKKAMNNLKIAKEKAEESEKLKSAFLANMSHEIRTPMNGILGFAELLKEPGLTGEEKVEYIDIIERSGRRMLNIINDIISISKLESGLMQLSIKETNVIDQLKYISTFFKPEAENKGLELICVHNLSQNEAIIYTDKEKLYAVLTNLVKNAIKFTFKGSIKIGCQIKEKNLEFYVEDTGIGIASEQINIIFERFRQGNESLTRNHEGAGLGLSISKAYVEMLGGKLQVRSILGKGSCFYFTVPYTSRGNQDKKQLINNKEALADHQGIRLKILIAEDDDSSELLLKKVTRAYSKEIIHVKSGREAVDKALENPDFDLILMDVRMPEMDGIEATRKIREFNKEVIIIVQTAFALTGDEENAFKAGCNDYICKPIKQINLEQKIEKFFKGVAS
jgi:PAS domain S-box-containing protein